MDNQNNNPEQPNVLDSLLENVPLETDVVVDLPSEGKFYRNFSQVTIKPMTFEDEKSVIASSKKGIDPINVLLENCVKGINISDLLLFDKMYILMKLREISYGENYNFSITCPKCGEESDVKMSFAHLLVNKVPVEVEDPREITLPVSKKKITVRFPRVRDEIYLKNAEMASNSLFRFVNKVETYDDVVLINNFIKKLPLKDIKVLMKEINRPDLGLDPRFLFDCTACEKLSEMEVPITPDFFSVT